MSVLSRSPQRASRLAALVAFPAAIGAGDPGSTRLVYAMVIGLGVVGVLFVLLGIWLVRQTRYDLPVLAPLERMGDADWRKRDEATRRRILDEARPEGAAPLHSEPGPPSFDEEFDLARRPAEPVSELGPGLSPSLMADGLPSPTVGGLFGEAVQEHGDALFTEPDVTPRGEPRDLLAEYPVDAPVEGSVDASADEPVDTPEDAPAEGLVEASVEESEDAPAHGPVDGSVEPPAR